MLGQNIRFAFRQLRKAPGFSLTVVLTLALGIGAVTAIFSLVEGVLLRPLPFSDPDRLVQLGDRIGARLNDPVTAREIDTYARSTNAFSSMGAYAGSSYELSGGATPEKVSAARLNAGVFNTLRVEPLVGRVFTAQDEDAHQPIAVLSYALWMNRFHRDQGVVGRTIELDRRSYTIIGVMPRNFEFPLQPGHLDQAQLWVPLSLTTEELSDKNTGSFAYHIVARLKDGVTMEQAAQDADRVARQIMRNFPAGMAAIHIQGDVKLLREIAVGSVRPLLRTLLVAVSVVLLIACVNVAGLLLVRAIRRRREFAVRLALGARSGAILRESVLEGLLLSLAGGLLGLTLAAIGLRAGLRLLPESMPRIDSISIDAHVMGFALLLALASGVLCSLAPGFAALRTNLIESLRAGVRTGAGAASHTWLRSTLVVFEIAIALVLLTVAGGFLRSFQRMLAVDPGFNPDNVLVGGYHLPANQYPSDASINAFNHAVLDRLANKPGVVAVGLTNALPASGFWGGAAYTIEGVPVDRWKLQFSMFTITYGDFFRTMRIPLIEGRTFTANDRADTPLVMIVNQSMAKHCWPGGSPIGKRMHVGNPKKGLPWATIVGVVADTKLGSRDEPGGDQWYASEEQPAILFGTPDVTKDSASAGQTRTETADGFIAVRSTMPAEAMTQVMRSTVAGIDPQLALQNVQPMGVVISDVEAPRRFNTGLITAFAVGALLLAITGIYAVVAFSVSLRTQEIAIRMALGAQRVGIARLVLMSGARLAALGCGLGLLGSLAVSRLVSSFLFGVSATDPLVYTAATLTMIVMAALASVLPAVRAASGDPIKALRSI
jgi:putative ABC transport system permease protein